MWPGPVELGVGCGVGWTAGWGNGGQRVFAVPALDLVMVVSAGRYHQPNSGRPLSLLARRVIDILGG